MNRDPPTYSVSANILVADALGIRPLATRMEIAEDRVRLTYRRSFHFRRNVVAEIPFTELANAREEKGMVKFVQRQDGLVQRIFTVRLRAKKHRERLLAALPKTIVEEPYNPELAAVLQEIADYKAALNGNVGFTGISCLILAACLVCFLWMCVSRSCSPTPADLIAVGGNFAPATLSGEWWRLFSCGFVHCGILHFAINMMVFFSVGRLAEKLFGHLLYGLIYVGALVGGSLLSIAVHGNIVSAGASGAIFGLFGAVFAYMARNKGAVPVFIRKQALRGLGMAIALNLLLGMMPGIDFWCHVGGLVTGFVCGLVAACPPGTAARHPALLKRILILAVLLPACLCPSYHLIKERANPFFSALWKCDVIDNQYQKNHADAEEPASTDPLLAEGAPSDFPTCISTRLDPQIEILESVPRQRITPKQAEFLDLYLQANKDLREAMNLHAKAIQTDDETLFAEAQVLYEKSDQKKQEIDAFEFE